MTDLPEMVVASLMSGTSADAIDGVVARFRLQGGELDWQVLARHSQPYPEELRNDLLRSMKPETSDVSLITQLHSRVGHAFAEAAAALAELVAGSQWPDLVAISGQTVYHIPRRDEERGWRTVATLQLGEAAIVADRVRVPVVSDFRQGDMAAGGQGAPLVPFGDLLLYRKPGVARAVHNLGGISNVTYLPADSSGDDVIAFDTGPANCLLDEAAQRFFGEPFDPDGRFSAAGEVDNELLARWLEHPYLRLPPPKTTGRELFELDAFITPDLDASRPNDLLATLTAFTAESIARAYRQYVMPRGLDEVLLAGGGASNPTLVRTLKELLPVPVRTFAEVGLEARDRESLAFGVMGYCGYNGLPNILPAATGAREPVVAGKLVDPRPRFSGQGKS